jgi:hypothetical protein
MCDKKIMPSTKTPHLIPIDLHCHSNWSDGVLSPAELVKRAKENSAQLLALTDHDCLDGLAEANQTALAYNLPFLNGVEISVTWQKTCTLHIVGLDIDITNQELNQGLAIVRSGRLERLKKMHDSLLSHGIHGVYEGALCHAVNPLLVGRMHIARYLVQIGLFDTAQSVFCYYLVPGKIGYVPHQWASLKNAITWILCAKGIPVLAHPARYNLDEASMIKLLAEFKHLGGIAIEAGSARNTNAEIIRYANWAKHFNLEVSAGSDFHAPHKNGSEIGLSPQLPEDCQVVWQRWLMI